MSSRLLFKRSNDLSSQELEAIRNLFQRVFGKDKSREHFARKYLGSPNGSGYHALCVEAGAIVAVFSALPYRYRYFGKDLVFALSVDTMVDPAARGRPFRVKKMAELVHDELMRDGIPFIYGFPNENYYEYEKKVIKSRDIGNLDYYVVPRNVGTLLAKGKLLNGLSRLASRLLVERLVAAASNGYEAPIQKCVDSHFEAQRYGNEYHVSRVNGGMKYVYKTYVEEKGTTATYLVDVNPLNARNFAEAVRRVYLRVVHKTDVLIYVGHLPFCPRQMLCVPPARRPKNIRMTGKILLPDLVDDRVLSLTNWNINISNFDVR